MWGFATITLRAAGAARGDCPMPLAHAIDAPRLRSTLAYCALARRTLHLPRMDQAAMTALVRDIGANGDTRLVDALAASVQVLQAGRAEQLAWCVAAALPMRWSAECTIKFEGMLTQCFEVRRSQCITAVHSVAVA